MNEIKAHPLTAVTLFAPFWIITAAPIVLRAVLGDVGGTYVALEAISLLALCLQSLLRTRALRLYVLKDCFVFKKGLLIKSETRIPFGNVVKVSFEKSPPFSFLSAERLTICTETKEKLHLLIWKKDKKPLLCALGLSYGERSIRVGGSRITLMTAAVSSAVFGVLTAVPIINRIGKVLDLKLSEILLDTVRKGSLNALFSLISLLFLFFYTVAFVLLLLKFVSMRIGLAETSVFIGAGVLPRRQSFIKRQKTNSILLEQRPIIRLTSRYIVKLSAAESEGGEVLFPAATRGEAKALLKSFFGIQPPTGGLFSLKHTAFRFIRYRLLLLLLAAAALMFLRLRFPSFAPIIVPVGLLSISTLAYLLSLARFSFKRGTVSFGELLFARFTKGFSVRELYCRRDRVGLFVLRRYKSDKKRGSCIFCACLQSKRGEKIKVKFINYAAAREYCLAFWKKQ